MMASRPASAIGPDTALRLLSQPQLAGIVISSVGEASHGEATAPIILYHCPTKAIGVKVGF